MAITATNDRSEVEIYRALSRRGHSVHLICHPDWQGDKPLREAGVKITELDIRHRLDLKASRKLREIIISTSPDVIYAPKNSTLSTALIATRGEICPVIGYRGTCGHLRRTDPGSLLTYFHPRLRAIVCVSEAVRQYLISKKIPEDMLHTIYKGHRIEWYNFSGTAKPDFSSYGVPPNAFVVGFTGNIRPVKGVEHLLRALPQISSKLNVHAVLAGEVRDKKIIKLAKVPEIAAQAHFMGYTTDAPLIAATCHAFVMPSVKREGLPRSGIEAMAQGVPAIVADVGGMPELVEDGISGLVVPPCDSHAIAEAITKLASSPDLCRKFGEAARKRIETAFCVDTTIDRMEQLFISIAQAHSHR
jgi:glycosyltransferase involved in cell wall biosynthesis